MAGICQGCRSPSAAWGLPYHEESKRHPHDTAKLTDVTPTLARCAALACESTRRGGVDAKDLAVFVVDERVGPLSVESLRRLVFPQRAFVDDRNDVVVLIQGAVVLVGVIGFVGSKTFIVTLVDGELLLSKLLNERQ